MAAMVSIIAGPRRPTRSRRDARPGGVGSKGSSAGNDRNVVAVGGVDQTADTTAEEGQAAADGEGGGVRRAGTDACRLAIADSTGACHPEGRQRLWTVGQVRP